MLNHLWEENKEKNFQIRMRYAQLVMGPAGSGKSTYCAAVAAHAQVSMIKRSLTVSAYNAHEKAVFERYRYSPAR
jgi:Fe-S cluster assembly ATPase SufC